MGFNSLPPSEDLPQRWGVKTRHQPAWQKNRKRWRLISTYSPPSSFSKSSSLQTTASVTRLLCLPVPYQNLYLTYRSYMQMVGWLCWGLTSQSTIFQSCRDGAIASWVINQYFRGVKCLAQGHNTVAVGLEPRTSRSGVRHSTTEPPRSPTCKWNPLVNNNSEQSERTSRCIWLAKSNEIIRIHPSMACAPSEDSDQPRHLHSLIRVLAVRVKKHWVFSYPLSAQWRYWSD